MTFEQWLAARGFDPQALTDRQASSLRAVYDAEVRAAVPAVPAAPATPVTPGITDDRAGRPTASFDETMAAIEAESLRIKYIEDSTARVAARHGGDVEKVASLREMAAGAIADKKCDMRAYDLALLRMDRTSAPVVFGRPEAEASDRVMEAAVCLSSGLPDVEKHFDAQTLDAAHKRFKNGVSLCDVIMTYARRGGYKGESVRQNLEGALRAAFNPSEPMAAGSWGPSTGGGLSGVLSNVANKHLRAGFESVDMAWREFSATASFSDFKTVTTYTMTGGLGYDKLPPGGEIKHGQLGAETYTNQLDTYAKMIGIDRRDLINDDLGALTGVSRRLGRGAATKLNDIFWTVFLNNSSFFTAGRNNVSTGGGSALSIAGLDAAYQKFLLQTDPDGNPVGVLPRILLVPPALYATARQLIDSPMLTIGSGTTATGSTNPWAGMFRVVTSPYMQNASYTGQSSAAWYLLADPNDVPVIETAFLNGKQVPTVEQADADFGMLGISLRGYFDSGVAFQEYRGGVRSAGS